MNERTIQQTGYGPENRSPESGMGLKTNQICDYIVQDMFLCIIRIKTVLCLHVKVSQPCMPGALINTKCLATHFKIRGEYTHVCDNARSRSAMML